MNSKVYRLLRNNKEQGPFSPDELISKGLKPYDLIWIDGRSAAWSYPGEITEFKNYVPDAGEQNSNVLIKDKATVSRISSAVQAAVAVNDNLIQAGIAKQKPRYKVSAAWSKIQTVTTPIFKDAIVAEPKKILSSKIINSKNPQPVNAKALSWEQAWRDWENEKKTVIPVKPQAVSNIAVPAKKIINTTATAVPVLEKKFEQSLDTITNNYIDSILQKKKKAKGFSFGKSSEFILPSVALIVIFSIGYWLLHNTKTAAVVSGSPVQQQVASVNKNDAPATNLNSVSKDNNQISAIQNNPVQQKQVDAVSAPASNAVKEKSLQHYVSNTNFIAPVKTSTTTNNVAANNSSEKNLPAVTDVDLKKTANTSSKQFDPSVINNIPSNNSYNDPTQNNNGDLNAAENRPVRRRTNGDDVTNNQSNNQTAYNNSATTKSTKAKSESSYVSVPEYVTMDNGNGSIKIQNISDIDLDLVVVDVQYYDGSGRFRKGETLYLHNLREGKAVTVKTPRDVNSSYATAKVSLVSSDANNVYAVGDN